MENEKGAEYKNFTDAMEYIPITIPMTETSVLRGVFLIYKNLNSWFWGIRSDSLTIQNGTPGILSVLTWTKRKVKSITLRVFVYTPIQIH